MRNISWVWVPSFVLLAASPASAGAIILSDIRTITGSVHDVVWAETADGTRFDEARFDDTFNFTSSASEFTADIAHRSPFSFSDADPLSQLTLTHWSIVSGDRIAARGSSDAVSHEHDEPVFSPGGDIVQIGRGTGSASAFLNMNVDFQLATPHRFDLNADLFSGDGENDRVLFSLCGDQGCLMNLSTGINEQRVSQSESGVLDAGVYTLMLFPGLFTGGDEIFDRVGGNDYDVDLQLTPVPEPGTMALFTVGLGILVSRRRKRADNVGP
jgi:hypothetical protein